MNDHLLGLGVSPGWTKTQATEPADHKTHKTCKQFDVFNSFSDTTGHGSDRTYDKKLSRNTNLTLNTERYAALHMRDRGE